MQNKAKLRIAIDERLQNLSVIEKERQTKLIIEKILSLLIWQEAKLICLYAPTADEVNLLPLLMNNKIFCLPRYNDKTASYELALVDNFSTQMIRGKYGILEPNSSCCLVDKSKVSLWLIPAVAFDKFGNRLGHGNGYYDRLLSGCSGFRLGICFSCQLIERIQKEGHDEVVDQVIYLN